MKIARLAILGILLSAPASAVDQSVISTMESYEEAFNPLEEMAATLASDPEFAGKILNVCVNGECLVLDLSNGIMEKGGMPETIASSEWSRDVATVVKAATGGVSGSATVKVKVTRVNKDGSSTIVEVDVKVEGKK